MTIYSHGTLASGCTLSPIAKLIGLYISTHETIMGEGGVSQYTFKLGWLHKNIDIL